MFGRVAPARALWQETTRAVFGLVTVSAVALAGFAVGGGAAVAADGAVTGAVYQDFNDSGTRDAAAGDFGGDTGVAGVAVTATDSAGAVVGTATTGADGSYSLAAAGAATAAVRVSFTLPDGYRAARIGAGNRSTVQFVTVGAAGVDLGVTQDGMVRTETGTPLVVVPSQRSRISADATQTGTAPTENLGTLPALFGVPYDTTGAPVGSGRTVLARQDQIGTVWGTANYGNNFVFSAASFRRGNEVGPAGLGGIYLTNARSGTPNASSFVQIPNTGTDPRGNINPDTYDWFHDAAAYDTVATIGLGDIEISSDQRTLYAVNLNDRTLYAVPLTPGAGPNDPPTAGTPVAIPLPLAAATGCDAAQVRPYGLGTFRGQLHVTLTCAGPTVQDLRAYVVPMNETTRQFGSPELNIALNYPRAANYASAGATGSDPYQPWRDTFAVSTKNSSFAAGVTPIASTVTFDSGGNILLSIKDRSADQNGAALGNLTSGNSKVYSYIGAGDLLRACIDAAGSYTLENDGECGGAVSTQPANNWGPGGGKFYQTVFTDQNGNNFHGNSALGSALQIPGYTNAMSTVLDPVELTSDGVRVFDHSNGRTARAASLTSNFHEPRAGTFSKAGGLGDLTTLAALAPVEIGNRVWLDADADGGQDAGETPIAGVTVRLFDDAGRVVATAVTDADGNYLFSSSPGTSTGSAIVGLPLAPGTNYELRLDNAPDYAAGGPLNRLRPSPTTAGSDTSADSNGVRQNATSVTAAATTPTSGSADHTFDFGFSPGLSLGNRLWFDTGAGANTNNGRFDTGEDPVSGAVVELLDGAGNPVLVGGEAVTATTNAIGFYRFDDLTPGNYRVRVAAANFAADAVLEDWSSSVGVSSAFDAASNNRDKGVDGGDPATAGVTSGTIALAPGVTVDVDAGATGAGANGPLGDQFDNLTADFGFVELYDLTLDKVLTSGVDPYRLGDEVTFTLTPSNSGPATAVSGLTVSDRLPAGLDFVSATGTDWSAAVVAGKEFTLTWQGAALAKGDSATAITVTARVTSTDAGTLRNVAVVEPSPRQRIPESIPVGSTPDRFENGNPTPSGTDPSNNDDSASIIVAAPGLSLGNRLWFDTGAGANTNNGRFDAGEDPVSGAVVELLDGAGNPVLVGGKPVTATTNADGFYRFDELVPGDYRVRVAASNFAADASLADFLSSTGANGAFDSASNNADKGVDASFPASTGITSGTIALAAGVTGEVDAGATGAGANGPFGDQFDNLTADFGFIPSLSLGNRLWFDNGAGDGEANNGTFDAGEKPVAGAVVQLLDVNGAPVPNVAGEATTATTDANGYYRFDGLPAGDYQVRVAASNFVDGAVLEKWFSSTPTSTDFGVNNSDKGQNQTDPATTGITSSVVRLQDRNLTGDVDAAVAGAGAHGPNGDTADLLTVDFGFTQVFAVGDYVWIDNDGDGQQDADEPAVPNALVTLLDASGNPAVAAGALPIAPVRTDANGHYVFDNLLPGSYSVSFSEFPPGYQVTVQAKGDATTDSNPNSQGVTPVFVLGPAGDHTTPVVAADGVTRARQIDRTIDAGLVPLLAVGDFVWFDADRDGVQDAGEAPVPGVTVTLLNTDGTPARDAGGELVAPVLTDAAGHYAFDSLLPGDYRAQFSNWPAGYAPTTMSVKGSSSGEDSNPDAKGLTPVFRIAGGGTDMRAVAAADGVTRAMQINPTIDFGLVQQLFAVGDYVWYDQDRDGRQDQGEAPVVGMTVTLFNADGTPARDWKGDPVRATKTDGAGHYVFDGLLPGNYYVEFTGVPDGYRFTAQGTGGGSDSNPNRAGRTPVFALGIDTADMRTAVGADGTVLASFINPTIDAGLVTIEPALPATGGAVPWVLAALSLVLLGGGALLLLRRRRNTNAAVSEESESQHAS